MTSLEQTGLKERMEGRVTGIEGTLGNDWETGLVLRDGKRGHGGAWVRARVHKRGSCSIRISRLMGLTMPFVGWGFGAIGRGVFEGRNLA